MDNLQYDTKTQWSGENWEGKLYFIKKNIFVCVWKIRTARYAVS